MFHGFCHPVGNDFLTVFIIHPKKWVHLRERERKRERERERERAIIGIQSRRENIRETEIRKETKMRMLP